MRGRGRKFTVLLALVVATASACAAYLAVAGSNREPDAPEAGRPAPTALPTDPVVVANWDIPAATTLTAEMLDVRQVPPDTRHPRALTDLDQAIGLRTDVPLFAGEQILDTRLTEQPVPEPVFGEQVPTGMRAMSITFDEVLGTGGLVQPGDHVDVIAYFEFKVDDLTVSADDDEDADEDADAADEAESDEAEADADDADDDEDGEVTVRVEVDGEQEEDDYHQYVAVYVVQNVQVLAVSQAQTPGDVGIQQREPERPATEAEAAVAEADEEAEPVQPQARPDGKSVTLALTPEQVPRVLLAAQTSTDKRDDRNMGLRLAVRAPGDTTIYDLPPAQLGTIPVGGLIGDVPIPLTPTELVISDVIFTTRVVNSGEILEFSATVKNVSDRTLRSGPNAPPEYVYTQGVAYDDLGFFAEPDTYRIGLNVSGAYPTPFPYRWGLGRDLAPGESTTIVGAVQLTEPTPGTRYWLGVIQGDNVITQDGMGVTEVTVLATEVVTVGQPSAVILAAPKPNAELVREVAEGERLTVLGTHGAWFHVRAGDAEGWIGAGSIVAEPATGEPEGGTPGSGGPELTDRLRERFIPWG